MSESQAHCLHGEQWILHRQAIIKLYRTAHYFHGVEKTQLTWTLQEFAKRNSLPVDDLAVRTLFEQLKQEAELDIGKIVAAIQSTPVCEDSIAKSSERLRIALKNVPIVCDFVLPANYGQTTFPAVLFRMLDKRSCT